MGNLIFYNPCLFLSVWSADSRAASSWQPVEATKEACSWLALTGVGGGGIAREAHCPRLRKGIAGSTDLNFRKIAQIKVILSLLDSYVREAFYLPEMCVCVTEFLWFYKSSLETNASWNSCI